MNEQVGQRARNVNMYGFYLLCWLVLLGKQLMNIYVLEVQQTGWFSAVNLLSNWLSVSTSAGMKEDDMLETQD